ncbi:hypothetical protein [Micromonospora sp. CPCC 206061]|uniref:hypothetical protein n=1 Tax=Micromonospora sp. CPCC 206061 TaxID=3122410 RepID=UPI002FF3335B
MRQHGRTRRGVGILTLVLATATFVVPPPAVAAETTEPERILTGQILTATGTLSGESVDEASLANVKEAAGAVVRLTYLTNPSGPDGGTGDMVVVANAVTDSQGTYTLSYVPDTVLKEQAEVNDGWANFILVVVTSDGSTTLEGVSRRWTGLAWEYNDREGMSPDDNRATYLVSDADTGRLLNGSKAEVPDVSLMAVPYPYCSHTVLQTHTAYTDIMEFHNSADADGRWEYGQTSDSDISLGLKPAGGNWSLGGTVHAGNSLSSRIGGATPNNYNRVPRTLFEYKRSKLSGNIRVCNVNNYEVVYATRWLGGLIDRARNISSGCVTTPQSNYRVQFAKGTSFYRGSRRAVTLGAAAELGFVSLSATSGYSGWVDMSWTFTRNWCWVCGNNDYPNYSKVVYVT